MKKYLLVMFVITLGLTLLQPTVSHSRSGGVQFGGGYRPPGGHHHHGGHGYYGGWYPYYGWRYPYYGGYGWWYGSSFFFGPWFFPPWYFSDTPSISYTPPPVVYAVPDTEHPYAYPDPAFIEKYGGMDSAQTSGEWVVVPGQYVNGVWVNEHKVWVAGSQ